MIVDRYYYGKLSESEKTIYREIYQGCMDHQDIIPVSYPITGIASKSELTKSFDRITQALMDDNPLLYYLNQSTISLAEDAIGNVAVMPQYFFSVENTEKYNHKIQDSVNQLIFDLSLTEGNDLEKVRKVHDYMCEHVTYDYEGADPNNITKMITTHNIIGVFAHKKAQCEGIAKAAKVLLNAVDVRCIYVGGKAGETRDTMSDHGWNIVNIEGNPYHLDITFDIGAGSDQYVAYDYYNVTDAQIRKDHIFATGLPKCSEKRDNYFEQNGLVFSSKRKLQDYVIKQVNAGSMMLYFKLAGKLKAADICDEVIALAGEKMRENGINAVKARQVTNQVANTCRITFSSR